MPLQFECPTCGKNHSVSALEDAPFRPFCSERCKLVDLGRWLDGTYCITEPAPAQNDPDSEGEDQPEPGS